MAKVQIYNFPDHVAGNTFDGVDFTLSINNVTDITGASIEFDFGHTKLNTASGNVVIIDATAGQFRIVSQIINFQRRTYDYEMRITFANGNVKTYLKGTWKIM